MNNLLVVIPAIKKNAVIPDQLIKKLNGVTLIQRAINTALEVTDRKNILIITDSEEISLISERNKIEYHYNNRLTFTTDTIIDTVIELIKNKKNESILLYRANTPLVGSEILIDAYNHFIKDKTFILTSVKREKKKLLTFSSGQLRAIKGTEHFEELRAFHVFSKEYYLKKRFKPYIIEKEKSIEIESYQDWWVCEKVLQRKRIVFNVIGNTEIGMGHIYHSLALAHEITDHEILFVCEQKYEIAVEKIASMDYKVISTENALDTILELTPSLVINDILDTDEKYINSLKDNGIKTVNFEDLGSGSQYADIVFNELYDFPQIDGENYYWGYKYLALRDEFYEATPHTMTEKIKEILLTFGGTDQNNLTLLSLRAILDICQTRNIGVNIVCGNGYKYRKELEEFLNYSSFKNYKIFYSCEAISKIMEKTQVAISSNGRTVYELADMNIPSIIISHHERESTHSFATLEKGFINLGVFNCSIEEAIKEKFYKLVDDKDYRELLFMNIKKFNFRKNKQKIVKMILEIL